MIKAVCHCRAVSIEVAAPPDKLTSCNCSVCRRVGGLWAYYTLAQVIRISGETVPYVWGDRTLALHHCPTCGCVTHWLGLDPALDRMGVNARMMEDLDLDSVRIRKFDGAVTWTYPEES